MSASLPAVPLLEPAQRLIRWDTVLRMVPLSKSTILREIDAGRFPRPRRVAKRLLAWSEADICAWIESTAASGVEVLQ